MTHHHPTDPLPCDRCGSPTASATSEPTQFLGGLQVVVHGYYGGFWDTMSFMGDEAVNFHLCHDCSAWLCKEIPKMAVEAKGGHFSSMMNAVKADPEVKCCDWGVVNHAQGEDHSPKERV